MSTLSRVKSVFKPPIPSGNTKKVNFVVVESLPHVEHVNQLIILQEIDNSTTTKEIIWRFSRYPEWSADRIRVTPKATSRQNPHFYLHLSKDAASFHSEFHKDPLKDFAHGLSTGDTIYVLPDKSCRLFFDAAKPHIYGNLWKPYRTVILKGEYSPGRVVCSSPRAFKILVGIWIQKTSSFARLGRAKTTGTAPPVRLGTASNLAARVVTAKSSRNRSEMGVLW
ncbi:hypothetical protein EDB89DRAFT_1364494 [Lactarius sanguifluus]|nr:hypothetical protein EDB89DRAFT_1364494 [Lactarius sanguifluus]